MAYQPVYMAPVPAPRPPWKACGLHLHFHPATHAGVGALFGALGPEAHEILEGCIYQVLEILYKFPELEPIGKVHCFQYDAQGTCPGGLIEGIADWVRLRAGLAPPHWSRKKPSEETKWDAGYERTAFFLDFLTRKYGGDQVVRDLNLEMSNGRWNEEKVWEKVLGTKKDVHQLWKEYLTSFGEEEEDVRSMVVQPTHVPTNVS